MLLNRCYVHTIILLLLLYLLNTAYLSSSPKSVIVVDEVNKLAWINVLACLVDIFCMHLS